MGKYFLRRFLELIPKLFIITVLIFGGMQLIPGDPITYLIPPDTISKLDPVQLESMREKLGLNANVAVRYFRWVGGILRGDFGYSLVSGASIKDMLIQRLPATFEVALISLVIAAVLGLVFGYFSATRQNTPLDYINTVLGMIGISIPEFFIGLLGISVFALELKLLPSGGRMAPGKETFSERIPYLILPCLCYVIGLIATLMRYTRGSMLDVLHKDYIKTARSIGLSELEVNVVHGFRNAMIPVVVILVNRLPMLVGGAVVIESVFNYPGMGNMLLNAINGSDMPVVMITTLITSVCILVCSLLIDVISALLDPRIRFGKE